MWHLTPEAEIPAPESPGAASAQARAKLEEFKRDQHIPFCRTQAELDAVMRQCEDACAALKRQARTN